MFDKVVKVNGGQKGIFITFPGYVRDKHVWVKMIDQTIQSFEKVDILVTNFGFSVAIISSSKKLGITMTLF